MNNSELCKKWLTNKTINPINNRKIKLNGTTYKYMHKLCNVNDNDNDNVNVNVNDNDNDNVKTVICRKWIKNKNKNPITNTKIKQNGNDYNKFLKLCYDKKILKIFNPMIKRITKNIIDRINYFVIIHNYINKVRNELKYNCVKKIDNELYLGNRIILDKQIGQPGRYGIVYQGYYKPTTTEKKEFGKVFKFAVKICEITRKNRKEIKIGKKINRLLIDMKCPHFLFCYGYLTCKTKKNNFNEIPFVNNGYFIINELADNTFSYLMVELYEKDKNELNKIFKNAFVQIYLSMMFFNKYTKYNHNDTHINNFLYVKIKEGGYYHYKLFGVDYYIENIGYLWVINDFGLASTLTSIKHDLIFFTNYMIKNIIQYEVFDDTITNFFMNLMKLLKKKTCKLNDIIIFINKHLGNNFITNKPSNIINKNPYIIE